MPTFADRRHVEANGGEIVTIGLTDESQIGLQVGQGELVELSPHAAAQAMRHLKEMIGVQFGREL